MTTNQSSREKLNSNKMEFSHSKMQELQGDIEFILKNEDLLKEKKYQQSLFSVLRALEQGFLRVSSPAGCNADCGEVPMENLESWVVHSWVKDAILFAMKHRKAQTVNIGTQCEFDINHQERVHSTHITYNDKFDMQTEFSERGVRALPGALVREGSYIARGAICMPSFVNLGAWVGANTMVDTWATVGSCAQIGKNVHIAGGVGIGGVLEPANARPVLIGDNVFLGSRVIVVEGVVIGEGAVLGANCCLTLSTPIYDVSTKEKKEYRGVVPPRAVVVPGTRMRTFPGGEVPLSCCYIIDYRNQKQDDKLSLNNILRTL